MYKRVVVWICVILVSLLYGVSCQISAPSCTSEIKNNGEGCQTRIRVEADILKDYFGGQSDKGEFCRSYFETCVQSVQIATDRKCQGVNASDQEHHARVNALRGFCLDLDVWNTHKSCVSSQINQGLKVCRDQFFIDKGNYTNNEYNKEVYPTEYAKRNAFCRLIRGNQICNERAIDHNCKDYAPYFRDYQVALLIPYCRQLYGVRTRYTTDDPNGATSSSQCALTMSIMVAISLAVKKFT